MGILGFITASLFILFLILLLIGILKIECMTDEEWSAEVKEFANIYGNLPNKIDEMNRGEYDEN